VSFLWVTADLAAPARSGGQIRTARLIKALSALAEVDVVLLSRSAVDTDAVAELCGARSVSLVVRPQETVRRRARAAWTRFPLQAASLLQPEAQQRAAAAAARGDTVIADHVWTAPYLSSDGSGVLHLHNAEASLLAQGPFRAGGVRALEHVWERATTRRLERSAVERAGVVVCVSELDAQRVGRPDALVVPNGTDLPSAATAVPAHGTLLFVGSMDYPPNREGVLWWLAEVAPLLPPDLPPLTVVGRSADRALAQVRDDPRVQLVADVPDVAPYLEAASVVVQPLLRGGGTRLKLVEALGHGRPVVATRLAAEGFPDVDGEHLRLVDDPRAMAAAVAELYRDREQSARLAAAGRAFATDYSWDRVGARFADAMVSFRDAAPRR
jgi:glycosyltransferase involved in cell wall biosynthesis